MPFTTVSGSNGKVLIGATSVGKVTRWEGSFSSNVAAFGSSEGAGHTERVLGRKDATGTVDWKFDSLAASPLLNGASVTLKLYVTATLFYQVPAVISNVRIMVDIDTGDVVGQTADWGENGPYIEPVFA